MKYLPWILTAILGLAVINLYFKVYDKSAGSGSGTTTNTATANGPLRMVYVNADSILENYIQFRKEKNELDKKQLDIDSKLGVRGKALENEVQAIQQKIQGGLLTPKEIQEQEQRLGAKQQGLVAERDRLAKEIQEEGMGINDRLQKVLISTLEQIKKDKGYQYIFSYVKGGQILLGNPADDITSDVLKALNNRVTAPADTTKK